MSNDLFDSTRRDIENNLYDMQMRALDKTNAVKGCPERAYKDGPELPPVSSKDHKQSANPLSIMLARVVAASAFVSVGYWIGRLVASL